MARGRHMYLIEYECPCPNQAKGITVIRSMVAENRSAGRARAMAVRATCGKPIMKITRIDKEGRKLFRAFAILVKARDGVTAAHARRAQGYSRDPGTPPEKAGIVADKASK